jgi:DNA uptake protein ComE-like DNA-binding protein
MFPSDQKKTLMTLKKKSKSLGQLAALGSPILNRPKIKKDISHKTFYTNDKHRFLNPSDHNSRSGPEFQHQTPTTTTFNASSKSITTHSEEHIVNINTTGMYLKGAKTPNKLKGLVRQKTTNSMPNPVAMGRALLAKAQQKNSATSSADNPSRNASTMSNVFGTKDADLIPNMHRVFLIDTQVKFTVGMQSQERNLFLFNDLLLIAKERSSSHFKLKEQIPLSDVWLSSSAITEVSEVTLDPHVSFVIGWPITNAVITFWFVYGEISKY